MLDIAVDSADPDVVADGGWTRPDGANADLGAVYEAQDGGLPWSPVLTVTQTDEDSSVNAVLIHPVTPTLWLAAVRAGNNTYTMVYRSRDGGATWTTPDGIDACTMSFAVNPGDSAVVCAGAMSPMSGAVLCSQDGGRMTPACGRTHTPEMGGRDHGSRQAAHRQ